MKNLINGNDIKRGDIVIVKLEDKGLAIGSEQAGTRPAVIIQNNMGNRYSPTVICLFLTSSTSKRILPTHVKLDGNKYDFIDKNSIILCEQIRTLDKSRILEKCGSLVKTDISRLNKALAISIDLN